MIYHCCSILDINSIERTTFKKFLSLSYQQLRNLFIFDIPNLNKAKWNDLSDSGGLSDLEQFSSLPSSMTLSSIRGEELSPEDRDHSHPPRRSETVDVPSIVQTHLIFARGGGTRFTP